MRQLLSVKRFGSVWQQKRQLTLSGVFIKNGIALAFGVTDSGPAATLVLALALRPQLALPTLRLRHGQLLQEQRDLLGIDATVVGHILLAPLVHVELALLALQALAPAAPQQRAAVVAAREELERVHEEAVRHIDVEALLRYEHLDTLAARHARTLGDHVALAPVEI